MTARRAVLVGLLLAVSLRAQAQTTAATDAANSLSLKLLDEGLNLAGVERVLTLERRLRELEGGVDATG